jgi:uncharacterized membrane protein
MTEPSRIPPALAAVSALEQARRLDDVARLLEPAARALVAGRLRRDLLYGRVAGHAIHPVLTDLPIGAWVSASVLDLTGGASAAPAARRLVGFGLLTAVPTVVTGLAEWAAVDRESKRVGVVHAAANAVGLALNVGSWVARRHGHRGRGVALTLVSQLALGMGGQLGGHLTLVRKEGSHAYGRQATT